jgi:nucleoside-diphosphate-sugar epimerase
MAKKILVLGGTSFIGLALVRRLLEVGADVTIATRGMTQDPFGKLVRRHKIERGESRDLKKLARLRAWDVIYDQICYSAYDAEVACAAFNENVGRYVLTSSIVVYDAGPNREEADFEARSFGVDLRTRYVRSAAYQYAEGKRSAEAVFFQTGKFPLVAVRFPNVLGTNDPSRRLDWHVECIKKGMPVFVPDCTVRQSVVWSEDAGRFLAWIGDQQYCGPINAASKEPVAIGELMAMVATELDKEVIYAETPSKANHSPFGFAKEFTIAVDLVERLGFRFSNVSDWLPMVIREHISSGPKRSRDPGLHAILDKLHEHEDVTADELKYLRRRIAQLERWARRK